MINSQRIGVVLPAYNAEATLSRTVAELDWGVVDEVVLVDDASSDQTVTIARGLGLDPIVHDLNKGYGGNQKTCYRRALELGVDVVIMVHPDYQYSPLLVPAMASLIAYGEYDLVLGSRILAQNSVSRGMPRYKYVANRFLTFVENIALGQKLSEYHTGLRAFSGKLLGSLPVERNSDDFVFDNQIIAQAVFTGARIGEVSCPTRYATDSSSINLKRSIKYGFGVLADMRGLPAQPAWNPALRLSRLRAGANALPASRGTPRARAQARDHRTVAVTRRQGHQLRREVANAAAARPGSPGHSGTRHQLSMGSLALVLLAVTTASGDQLMLKHGMQLATARARGPGESLTVAAATTPWVLAGLMVFTLSAVVWLAALSRVPLSIAYPFNAVGYLVILGASTLVLHERASLLTWLGSLIVVSGLLMVVLSKP